MTAHWRALAAVAALAAAAAAFMIGGNPSTERDVAAPANASPGKAEPSLRLPDDKQAERTDVVFPERAAPTAPPVDGPTAFAAAVKAAREAPQPPPPRTIAEAKTFEEAFEAMKQAERQPAAAAAGANPFGASR